MLPLGAGRGRQMGDEPGGTGRTVRAGGAVGSVAGVGAAAKPKHMCSRWAPGSAGARRCEQGQPQFAFKQGDGSRHSLALVRRRSGGAHLIVAAGAVQAPQEGCPRLLVQLPAAGRQRVGREAEFRERPALWEPSLPLQLQAGQGGEVGAVEAQHRAVAEVAPAGRDQHKVCRARQRFGRGFGDRPVFGDHFRDEWGRGVTATQPNQAGDVDRAFRGGPGRPLAAQLRRGDVRGAPRGQPPAGSPMPPPHRRRFDGTAGRVVGARFSPLCRAASDSRQPMACWYSGATSCSVPDSSALYPPPQLGRAAATPTVPAPRQFRVGRHHLSSDAVTHPPCSAFSGRGPQPQWAASRLPCKPCAS